MLRGRKEPCGHVGDTIRVMGAEQAFRNPLPYNGHDLSKGVTPFGMREAHAAQSYCGY